MLSAIDYSRNYMDKFIRNAQNSVINNLNIKHDVKDLSSPILNIELLEKLALICKQGDIFEKEKKTWFEVAIKNYSGFSTITYYIEKCIIKNMLIGASNLKDIQIDLKK